MFKKSLQDAPQFVAGDETLLREILHPHHDAVKTGYSIAHAQVKPGKASLPHRLTGSEVYYILEGIGKMYIEKKTSEVQSGDTIYVPPHALQYIENTGSQPLIFICIVEPAWTEDGEEID